MLIASVTLNPLQRIVSRTDIECPGDIFPYNCSIASNSEALHLMWRVTLTANLTINITYNSTSSINDPHSLHSIISTMLTQFTSDKYVESVLNLTVTADVPIQNQTKIECIIENLGKDIVYVPINTSGSHSNFVDTAKI